jgi:hypothetical protein
MSARNVKKPVRVDVVAENIPERIRKLTRWVVWNWKRGKGKWDKPPLQLSGALAAVDDLSTWTSFEQALAAHQEGKFDGVGFVLGYVLDEDVTYAGVDLDDCRNPQTGQIQDWALAHLQTLRTYVEVSPSGEGIKALALGTLPGPSRNESQRLGMEVYAGGRYFTVTGHTLPDSPIEIGERTAELADIYYSIFGNSKREGSSARTAVRPDDRELALSALAGLSPSLAAGYWDWLKVGMALHAVGDDVQMMEAWDQWSQHCSEKYESGVCERKWKSFGKKGGLGLGSLIHWAKENGWTFPKAGAKVESSANADAPVLERLAKALTDGPEALFRDRELLEALARLAETDPPEFACARAKIHKAKISLQDINAALSPLRQALRAQRSPRASADRYRVVGGRIVQLRTTRHGEIEVALSNFEARVTEVVTRDDAATRSAMFAVEGQLVNGRPLPRLQVPATDFQGLGWVTTGWHGEAVVMAGAGTRDHLRCAIELLSPDRVRRVQYLHTGWREIGDQWVFLHSGGGIGKDGLVGGIEVDLSGDLRRVNLPPPPSAVELAQAVRASLDLLTLARFGITVPVLAAVYRAPLGDVDFSLHLVGPSGKFKSELAALAQGHFGVTFDARSLPGSWSSTDNALEELAFTTKDMLVVVDDFKPHGGMHDVQAYHRKADRLFRAVGNHSGRQRLNRDGKLLTKRRPRGLVVSTGEEIPQGESLRARLLIVEIGPGDIETGRLTVCQRQAAAGLYAASMAGYLQWLARHYAAIRAGLRRERDGLRDQARAECDGGHARSPGIVADLALGLKYLLDYAVEVGAISEGERTAMAKRCWAALREAVAAQAQHVEAAEPTGLFLRLLTAALASGRAHLADPNGLPPAEAPAWGWRLFTVGSGDSSSSEWRPQGRHVGWVEHINLAGINQTDNVYLEPEAAFAEAQALAREQGETLAISARTLRRRLRDGQLLVSADNHRQVLTVRRVLEGKRREVLHIQADLLHSRPDQPDQPDHCSKNAEKIASPRGQVSDNRPLHPTTHPTTELT